MRPQEILAALVAAIVHDFRHPGVSNTFLVGTQHDLAVLHNDISVLENYHCSEAFMLMYKEDYNFLESLSPSEYVHLSRS